MLICWISREKYCRHRVHSTRPTAVNSRFVVFSMFFQRGKRKGNATFEIVEAGSNKKTNMILPAPIPKCSKEEETAEKNANYGVGDHDTSDCECDPRPNPLEFSHKRRREKLTSNWGKVRDKLVLSSLAVEGFVEAKCSVPSCTNVVETRCRHCGFSVYLCCQCCEEIHKNKHHFHVPEILKVTIKIPRCRLDKP